jgi:Protein of unknown function (DUF3455)
MTPPFLRPAANKSAGAVNKNSRRTFTAQRLVIPARRQHERCTMSVLSRSNSHRLHAVSAIASGGLVCVKKAAWLSAAFGVLAALTVPVATRATEVPAAVAAGAKGEIMKLHAEGVQIYECKAEAGKAAAWTFREPLAVLMKDGATVGRHYGGPSWELATGGAIVAKVDGQAPGSASGDIKLLRLNVTERRGEGELAKTSVIQRLETHGGAFAGPCATPGALHLEPYSAEYVFLRD